MGHEIQGKAPGSVATEDDRQRSVFNDPRPQEPEKNPLRKKRLPKTPLSVALKELEKNGDPEKGLKLLKELKGVNPADRTLDYHIARALLAAGQDKKAKAAFLKIAGDDSHPNALHARTKLQSIGKG